MSIEAPDSSSSCPCCSGHSAFGHHAGLLSHTYWFQPEEGEGEEETEKGPPWTASSQT